MPAAGPEALVYPLALVVRIGVETGLLRVRKHLDPETENPDRKPYPVPYPERGRWARLAVDYDNDISS